MCGHAMARTLAMAWRMWLRDHDDVDGSRQGHDAVVTLPPRGRSPDQRVDASVTDGVRAAPVDIPAAEYRLRALRDCG
jgi:hypothetical protein